MQWEILRCLALDLYAFGKSGTDVIDDVHVAIASCLECGLDPPDIVGNGDDIEAATAISQLWTCLQILGRCSGYPLGLGRSDAFQRAH